jgi:predicted PhzF superfamily epimerase YddE/YHI9
MVSPMSIALSARPCGESASWTSWKPYASTPAATTTSLHRRPAPASVAAMAFGCDPAWPVPRRPFPAPPGGLARGNRPPEWCFNAPVTDYDVLRVFCGPSGGYGSQLGVVRDGSAVPGRSDRQALAARLGFGETVFVDDPERGIMDIRTPTARLAFAGNPCVGTAWLLDVPELVTPAGVVGTRLDGEFSWIDARAEWAPPYELRQCGSASEVDALPRPPQGEGAAPAPPGQRLLYVWAWEDEAAGRIRARGFRGHGDETQEDEATGEAALILTDRLGRALNITQGRGSQILTAPQPGGWVEVGGRVFLER